MWYKNVGTSFFRFVTNHAFDRRTDGLTDGHTDRRSDSFLVASPRWYSMQRGKKLDSVGYIFVADTVGLASVSLNL